MRILIVHKCTENPLFLPGIFSDVLYIRLTIFMVFAFVSLRDVVT